MMKLPLALSLFVLSVPAAAQGGLVEGVTPSEDHGGSYAGPASGNGILPASLRNAFGNSNNNIPFSWRPTRYQQVFLGSELPRVRRIVGLGLRQDNAFSRFRGQTIDVEIKLGATTFNHSTLTNNYANNFNVTSPPPVTVLPRSKFRLPDMPSQKPTNPAVFFIQIPFKNAFTWIGVPNRNLLIEVIVRGNSNNNRIFTFPLDAGSGLTTTRLFASGNPNATTGTLGRGFGHVMCFLDKLSTTASYTAFGTGCKGTGGSGSAIPVLGSTGRPVLNQTFSIDLAQGRRSSVALLVLGLSDKLWGAFRLPLDLTGAGAPGCSLLASFDLAGTTPTSAAGTASVKMAIPNDRALSAAMFFNQFIVLDKPANRLGLAFSNGGKATIGDK